MGYVAAQACSGVASLVRVWRCEVKVLVIGWRRGIVFLARVPSRGECEGYLGFGGGLWGRDARSWRRTLAIGRASAPLWTRRLVLQLPVWDEPATVG